MRSILVSGAVAIACIVSFPVLAKDGAYGHYVGRVVAIFLKDGRTMKLVEPFEYISPVGTKWIAPKDSIIDGASIPQWAWSAIGGLFEGRYRDASVIHDVACDEKSRPWHDVHYAFYTGMLASGVGEIKAKIMYAAVYLGGPRWPAKKLVTAVPPAEINFALRTLQAEVGAWSGPTYLRTQGLS